MIYHWIAAVLFLSTANSEIQHDILNGIHPKFENIFHHLSYHQRFAQQLKGLQNVEFDLKDLISKSSSSSCLQMPSPKCVIALTKVSKNIPKCEY